MREVRGRIQLKRRKAKASSAGVQREAKLGAIVPTATVGVTAAGHKGNEAASGATSEATAGAVSAVSAATAASAAASAGRTPAGWHQIESFIRCPKEYQFAEVRGIRIPSQTTPDHFAIGTLLHVAKAAWFELGFKADEAAMAHITKLVANAATLNKLPVTLQAEQRAMAYFLEYVEHWAPRPKPKVIAAEYTLGPAPLLQGDPKELWRTARVDDVSRYEEAGGGLCIGETKSTGDSIAACAQQYTLHGQPMLQALLWDSAPQGAAKHGPITGVMLDVIQKGYSGQRSKFGRVLVPITQHALQWFARSLQGYVKASRRVEWDTEVPRNITACTRMVGRGRVACPYRDLCMYGRSAAMKYVLANGTNLGVWKPSYPNQVQPWL